MCLQVREAHFQPKVSGATAGTMHEDLILPCFVYPKSHSLGARNCWAEEEKMTMSLKGLQSASRAER